MIDSENGTEPSSPIANTSPHGDTAPEMSEANGAAHGSRKRGDSKASSIGKAVRKLSYEFEESHPPEGFMAATGDIASSLVAEQKQQHRVHESEALSPIPSRVNEHEDDTNTSVEKHVNRGSQNTEAIHGETAASEQGTRPAASDDVTVTGLVAPSSNSVHVDQTEPFENGYHFPPKYSALETTKQGLLAFWKLFKTPMGFFWIIYGLNVVAWGGMLFLLLCNAAPAMCRNGNGTVDCNNIDSPRRVWVEIDSQILNALFCVTGFGLAPWRFRDLYYLLKYRVRGQQEGLRRLAGIHRGWYRLQGSENLPVDVGPDHIPNDVPESCIAIPPKYTPDAPLTGTRAPATKQWKLDFVIWTMVWNTFAQGGLSGTMWGLNRYNRPSWVTGFLVAVACIIAMVGGLMMFLEGNKVKSIEGVALNEQDIEKLREDKELGIPHYNNIKDKKPKAKVQDPEAARARKPSMFKRRLNRNKDSEKH